jgi:predicted nucleic acid-binding protein
VIVLDASAAVEWLLHTQQGLQVDERIFSGPETFHAPHLIDVEVTLTLRRLAGSGTISVSRAEEALEDLLDLRMTRYSHGVLLRRIWELRNNFTAYDAVYVALAEVLEATLITCDGKLALSPGHHANIEVIQAPVFRLSR